MGFGIPVREENPTRKKTYASMTPCRIRRWVTTLLLLTSANAAESRTQQQQQLPAPRSYVARGDGYDFVCTRVLPDGEVERRIHRGHISAIETTVELFDHSSQNSQQQLLTLLQVTDGHHFIQLIYDSGLELRDCEYLKSAKSVDEFYEAFAADVDCRQQWWNQSRTTMLFDLSTGGNNNNNSKRPDVTDYASLRRSCKTLHKRIREMASAHHHHINNSVLQQRLKRDAIYPGTYWCGFGSLAESFAELGYKAAVDSCCRDHDHCPHIIGPLTEKFNYFNFRLKTISHCDCDKSFRTCLKLTDTFAGNMVGKMYFNLLGVPCFRFKRVRTCKEKSWFWGECLKFEKKRTAVLRDALTY